VKTSRLLTMKWTVASEAVRRSAVAGGRGLDVQAFAEFAVADAVIALAVELVGEREGCVERVVATIAPPKRGAVVIGGEMTGGAAGRWEEDEDARLVHVTIGEPTSDTPLLVATVRLEEGGVSVLYARTTLLAYLGIPGGRYEVAGATMETGVGLVTGAR